MIEDLHRATVITRNATEIHDRMPLILPAERIEAWLNPQPTDPAMVRAPLTGIELDGSRCAGCRGR